MKDATYKELRKQVILERVGKPRATRKPEPTSVTPGRLEDIKRMVCNDLDKAHKMGMLISVEHDPIGPFNFREGYKGFLNKSGKRTITIIIEG